MSSIFSNATMTVIFQEEVELNSTKYGGRTQFKIGQINEVSQRIVNVPTSQTTILQLSASVGPGTYVTSNTKYVRLTNLDNENWVRLTFVSGSANQYDVRLDPRKSYVFTNSKISGSAAGATFNAFSDFDTLKAVANSAAVDVEMFVASQ